MKKLKFEGISRLERKEGTIEKISWSDLSDNSAYSAEGVSSSTRKMIEELTKGIETLKLKR